MFFTKFWTNCPYLCLGFFGNTIIIIPGNYVGPLKGWVAYDMNHKVRKPVFVVCEHEKHISTYRNQTSFYSMPKIVLRSCKAF